MRFHSIIKSLLLVFCSSQLFAQPEPLSPDFTIKGVAIGINAPELIEQMMVVMPGLGSNAKNMTKEQSIKSYLMPPRQVGERGTVASYTLAACLEFYSNFKKNYKVNLSPDYIALNLLNEGQSDLKNSLRFLVTDGTVSADIVPYDSPSIPRSVGAAEKYRISNYLQIVRESHRGRQKVFEVQKALMRGNPVIIEMLVPRNFDALKDTRFWTAIGSSEDRILLPFLVVGYNLDLDAFEISGVWGPEWGTNGYLWVDFDDFAEIARNGYVMVPQGF